MKRTVLTTLVMVFGLTACQNDVVFVENDVPDAPQALGASYYAGTVTVTWELGAGWNNEPFRVYSRRVTDPDFFFIAEVTSCFNALCSYDDTNVTEGETYEYLVAAVSPSSGIETETANSVTVLVPVWDAPPVPDAPAVIALDNANYVIWGVAARAAADFSHYKVYQDLGGSSFFLGETDSEGFLDLLAGNGDTYSYFVTSVDTDGHESTGSFAAEGTPRPDFKGEWLYDDADQPTLSGFRFTEDEGTNPIMDGGDPARHFRLESDPSGWWLVPGPNTAIYPTSFATTALKCGVAADATCTDVTEAPTTGYVTTDVQLFTHESFIFRVVGNDGLIHYGIIRPELLGTDQAGDGIMIFDWAYQLQANNPSLSGPAG